MRETSSKESLQGAKPVNPGAFVVLADIAKSEVITKYYTL